MADKQEVGVSRGWKIFIVSFAFLIFAISNYAINRVHRDDCRYVQQLPGVSSDYECSCVAHPDQDSSWRDWIISICK